MIIFTGFGGFTVRDTYPMFTHCHDCPNHSRFTLLWPSQLERSLCPTCFIRYCTMWIQNYRNTHSDYERLIQTVKQYLKDNPDLALEV